MNKYFVKFFSADSHFYLTEVINEYINEHNVKPISITKGEYVGQAFIIFEGSEE